MVTIPKYQLLGDGNSSKNLGIYEYSRYDYSQFHQLQKLGILCCGFSICNLLTLQSVSDRRQPERFGTMPSCWSLWSH